MDLHEEFFSAKKLIEQTTGINTSYFNISSSNIVYGEDFYLTKQGTTYNLKYVDERGSVTFYCKKQPLDVARYHSFKLLVEFCSLEYFRQFKIPFDRFVMFEKQLEYMALIESIYVPILKGEIDNIIAKSV